MNRNNLYINLIRRCLGALLPCRFVEVVKALIPMAPRDGINGGNPVKPGFLGFLGKTRDNIISFSALLSRLFVKPLISTDDRASNSPASPLLSIVHRGAVRPSTHGGAYSPRDRRIGFVDLGLNDTAKYIKILQRNKKRANKIFQKITTKIKRGKQAKNSV